MIKARDLLGQVMQVGMTETTANRLRHAMEPGGPGGGANPLAQLFGQGGALGGLAGRAENMVGDASRSVQSGNPLAVGGLGALAGAVLGGGRGALKGALGGGVLALLGGIAMTALRNQTGAASGPEQLAKEAPLGLREPQTPAEEAEIERTAELVLRAMVNAAKADGQIDGGEMQRIVGKLEEGGADAEARAFVLDEMRKPPDLDGLVAAVPSREVAVEVYAASLLAIEVDTPAEREYLRGLAERLGLDAAAVQRVHGALGVPLPA